MKKFLFVGNWKMNKTLKETEDYFKNFLQAFSKIDLSDREIVICPPFTSLLYCETLLRKLPLKLGAQNACWEEKGAFTGEISPLMLKELRVEYVILGHSERRHIFGETDKLIAKRVAGVYKQGLTPILCVGETLEQRKKEKTLEVIREQLLKGLEGIKTIKENIPVIAYEPVWAIGTGINATPDQAEEVHLFIRKNLVELYSEEIGKKIRILYGGSVTPENVKELMEKPNIDGVLVGGASLDPEKFFKICSIKVEKSSHA